MLDSAGSPIASSGSRRMPRLGRLTTPRRGTRSCASGGTRVWWVARHLDAIRRPPAPGGCALLGETIWEQPHPSAAAQEALGASPEDFPTLAQFLRTCEQHGFEVGYAHVSGAKEWDDYEWSWTGSLVEWARERRSEHRRPRARRRDCRPEPIAASGSRATVASWASSPRCSTTPVPTETRLTRVLSLPPNHAEKLRRPEWSRLRSGPNDERRHQVDPADRRLPSGQCGLLIVK